MSRLSVCPSVYLFVSLCICKQATHVVRLSVCPSICMSVTLTYDGLRNKSKHVLFGTLLSNLACDKFLGLHRKPDNSRELQNQALTFKADDLDMFGSMVA